MNPIEGISNRNKSVLLKESCLSYFVAQVDKLLKIRYFVINKIQSYDCPKKIR